MPTISWIVIGLIVGLVVTAVDREKGPGTVVDIILGVAGAVVAEALFRAFGGGGGGPGYPVDYWGVAVAVGGAVLALAAGHAGSRLLRRRKGRP